jgi:histone-lysine N-methyltransferase SETD2
MAQPAAAHNDRSELDAIIAMAQQVQAAPLTPLPPTPVSSSSRRSRDESSSRKRQKTSHRPLTAEEERRKEKRLTVLIGEVVVNSMSKYKEQMEHETFKRYAKDVSISSHSFC